jgi:hypothetical protein
MSRVVAFLNGPGGAFGAAVVIFALALVGHATLSLALLLAGIMVAYGLVLLVGRRWEPIAVLSAPVQDERAVQVHTRASAAAGNLLALVIVGGFLYDLARGGLEHSIWPPLGAIFGAAYLVALVIFVRRS